MLYVNVQLPPTPTIQSAVTVFDHFLSISHERPNTEKHVKFAYDVNSDMLHPPLAAIILFTLA